jgi:hypothetical protein
MYTNPHTNHVPPLSQRGQPPSWALANATTRRVVTGVVGGLLVWLYCLLLMSFLM